MMDSEPKVNLADLKVNGDILYQVLDVAVAHLEGRDWIPFSRQQAVTLAEAVKGWMVHIDERTKERLK